MLLAFGRLLARSPTPRAMGLLGFLAMVLPTSRDAPWDGAARRQVWRLRGEALWASRQPPVALCRRLSFEGWEHLHRATEHGRGVIFIGIRPAGWEFALLALGRYGSPVTLATVDSEDDLLLEDHIRVGNVLSTEALRRQVGSVCAAFLGIAGEPEVPLQLETALAQGAAVVPLFAYRDGRGWRLTVRQGRVFEERLVDPSKEDQVLRWVHRICMRAVEAEAHL